MTTVLALILICIWHYFKGLPNHSYSFFNKLCFWLINFKPKLLQTYLHGLNLWLFITLPVILSLLIAQFFITAIFGKLGQTVFTLAVLYYCMSENTNKEHSLLVTAHEQKFGILFWLAILGPLGAFAYWWLIKLSESKATFIDLNEAQLANYSTRFHAIAAWLPARVTGFIYALVGNFTNGFASWLKCMQSPGLQSSTVLSDCGQASLIGDDTDPEATSLVTRALFAWYVLSISILLALNI